MPGPRPGIQGRRSADAGERQEVRVDLAEAQGSRGDARALSVGRGTPRTMERDRKLRAPLCTAAGSGNA